MAQIISDRSSANGLVVDPFSGGGVVGLEAFISNRRSYSCDYNPLATFISVQQASHWHIDMVQKEAFSVVRDVGDLTRNLFQLPCPGCKRQSRVAWTEHSIVRSCEQCDARNIISTNKKHSAGKHLCNGCNAQILSVRTVDDQTYPICLRIECEHCGLDQITSDDNLLALDSYNAVAADLPHHLSALLPSIKIPDNNMQRESAQHKKGFRKYSDLFTKRALHVNAALLNRIDAIPDVSIRNAVLFVFSSSLRYTSTMVCLNPAWRKDEPLEWNKPGFWMPPVFLETNPIRHFQRRAKSILSAKSKLQQQVSLPRSKDPCRLLSAGISYECRSGSTLPLDTNSVDVIVTDPPYGSYVHYADLSNFWTSWLRGRIGCDDGYAPIADEAVPARKHFPTAKTFEQYTEILSSVFLESKRVLKHSGALVLTFNNREPRAWAALLEAVERAGFDHRSVDVTFASGIRQYAHTSQLRRAGSVHGDFVLAFSGRSMSASKRKVRLPLSRTLLVEEIHAILASNGPLSNSELFRMLYANLLKSDKVDLMTNDGAELHAMLESSQRRIHTEFSFDGARWAIRK